MKVNNLTMRQKILTFFAATCIVTVATIGLITINSRIADTRSSEAQKNAIALSACKNYVQNSLRSINVLGMKFTVNPDVANLMSESFQRRPEDAKRKIINSVNGLTYDSSYRAVFKSGLSVAFFCEDGRVYANTENYLKEINVKDSEIINVPAEIPDSVMSYQIRNNDVFTKRGDVEAEYLRHFMLSGYSVEDGTIALVIPRDIFRDAFSTTRNQEWTVLDRNNVIIESNNETVIGSLAADVYGYSLNVTDYAESAGYYMNGMDMVSFIHDEENNLTYLMITKRASLTKSINSITRAIVLISVLLLFLLLGFAWYLSKRFTEPLNKLELIMAEAEEGNLDARVNLKSDDEIGTIGKRFNKMMDQLKSSMYNIQRVEQENRKAEMKIMELQLKPHFLYNTLSSIIWLASEDKKDEVIDITKALAMFYRITLSDGREEISVREEVENVRNYAKIQNYRYKGRFKFFYNTPEEIESCIVPKLILQPLVENSINYGMKLKETDNGYIGIIGYIKNGDLVFEIRDNGDDATEESIDELNSKMLNGISGIGTGNVYGRVHHYGEKYELKYERIDGVTIARINLPINAEGLND